MDENDFKNQRRNLIVISSIIIVINLLGLKFEQINILGNKASIAYPENVDLIILFIFIYAAIRFIQVFIETSYQTFFSNINSKIYEETELAARDLVKLKKNYIQAEKDSSVVNIKIHTIGIKYLSNHVHEYTFRIEYAVKRQNNPDKTNTRSFDEVVALSKLRQLAINTYCYIYYFVFRTQFTEYLLPPILALLAVMSPWWTNYLKFT